jgi:DNA repair and recombination protein RAD52
MGSLNTRKTENDRRFNQSQAARIARNLEKKLGPEFISYRTGSNMTRLAYLEGWTAINLANQIFGFNGWSSEIRDLRVDYEEVEEKKHTLGISCMVRITLKDGTHREDVGFGSAEKQKTRAMAYEKAKKEAATDALKRALRQFGNSLGNCCYDRSYIKDIQRVSRAEEEELDLGKLLRRGKVINSQSTVTDKSISLDADAVDSSTIDD